MFFSLKSIRFNLVFAFIGLVLLGCSDFLNDKKNTDTKVSLEFNQTQCLDSIPRDVENYFRLKGQPGELNRGASCLVEALNEFKDLTRGKNQVLYTDSALKFFTERYLLKKDVSEDLVKQVMLIKRVILGGELNSIAKNEIEDLNKFIVFFSAQLESLRPNLRYILGQATPEFSNTEEFIRYESSFLDLQNVISVVLPQVHLHRIKYGSDDLKSLVIALKEFKTSSKMYAKFSEQLEKIESYMPMLDRARYILVGDSLDLRGINELVEVSKVLVQFYKQVLVLKKHTQDISQENINNPLFIDYFFRISDELISVIIKGLQLKREPIIFYADISKLMDSLYPNEKLMGVENSIWIETLRKFVFRFLDENHSRYSTGVHRDHFRKLQLLLRSHQLRQRAIGKYYSEFSLVNRAGLNVYLEKQDIDRLSRDDFGFGHAESELVQRHWELLKRTLNRKYKYTFNSQYQWMMDGTPGKITFREASIVNFYLSITLAIFESYLPKDHALKDGMHLNTKDLLLFDQEFSQLTEELGISDKRSADGGASRAQEADLFTRAGNGDVKVQIEELFELVLNVGSTGFGSFGEFYKTLSSCQTTKKDYFGNFYLNTNCSKMGFQKNVNSIFPQLPDMVRYLSAMSEDQSYEFFERVLGIAKVCSTDQNGIETADRRKFVMIVGYVESLIKEYDVNLNGVLELSEVEQSYGRFESFLIQSIKKRVSTEYPKTYKFLEFTKYDWALLARPTYIYLLKNGEVPSFFDLITNSSALSIFVRDNKDSLIERINIVKVFSALKTELNGSDEELCAKTALYLNQK